MTDPWDERYVYLLIYHKINHSCRYIYVRPMDPMGKNNISPAGTIESIIFLFPFGGICMGYVSFTEGKL